MGTLVEIPVLTRKYRRRGERLCSVNGCGRHHHALGLCNKHWMRAHYRGELALHDRDRVRNEKIGGCVVDGCAETVHARGLCKSHYGAAMAGERQQRWRDKHRERIEAKKYGLTVDELRILRARSVCDICGKAAARLEIDHDHKTGAVRGLLCMQCNGKLLPMLESVADFDQVLSRAKAYLERPPGVR